MVVRVQVQTSDFDIGAEIARIREEAGDIGAVVSFTGTVREMTKAGPITEMTLEHYPGMTERELEAIANEASTRWPLAGCCVIHRYGTLAPGDNIVLVITASAHRESAFDSARFLMDYLKTSAPFWKSETGADGPRWVSANDKDDAARARWGAE